MTAVVPKLYLDLGWPYARRPSREYVSPSGTLTLVNEGQEMPCNVDREILLYIIKIAHDAGSVGVRARGDLRELCTWLGTQRRGRRIRPRLSRVISCRVLWRKSDGEIRIIRIGELEWLGGGAFHLLLDPEFHESCLRGVPYSLELAARYRSEPALLDLYLALVLFVHEIREYDEFTHEFFPYEFLPLPSADHHARSHLAARVEKLQGACPGAFFVMAPSGLGIWVDIGHPKRVTRAGVSRYDWEANDRYGRMIRRLDPAYRRQLGNLVTMMETMLERLDNHDMWAEVFQVLHQAGDRTDLAFEELDRTLARVRAGIDRPEPEDE